MTDTNNNKYNNINKEDEYRFNSKLFDERVSRSFRRVIHSTIEMIAFHTDVINALSVNPDYNMYSIPISNSNRRYVIDDFLWDRTTNFSTTRPETFGDFEEL